MAVPMNLDGDPIRGVSAVASLERSVPIHHRSIRVGRAAHVVVKVPVRIEPGFAGFHAGAALA